MKVKVNTSNTWCIPLSVCSYPCKFDDDDCNSFQGILPPCTELTNPVLLPVFLYNFFFIVLIVVTVTIIITYVRYCNLYHIMSQIREGFYQANFGDLGQTIKAILQHAISICSTRNILPWASVLVSVRHKTQMRKCSNSEEEYEDLCDNHVCAFTGMPEFAKGQVGSFMNNVKADVINSPLTSSFVTVETYIAAVQKRMVQLGYSVRCRKVGFCGGFSEGFTQRKIESLCCGGKMFSLHLRWHW